MAVAVAVAVGGGGGGGGVGGGGGGCVYGGVCLDVVAKLVGERARHPAPIPKNETYNPASPQRSPKRAK